MDIMKAGFYCGFGMVIVITILCLVAGDYGLAADGFICCFVLGLFGLVIGIYNDDDDDWDDEDEYNEWYGTQD